MTLRGRWTYVLAVATATAALIGTALFDAAPVARGALANTGNLWIPSTGSVFTPFLQPNHPDFPFKKYYDNHDNLLDVPAGMVGTLHTGVDISNGSKDCDSSLPVYAAASGEVIWAGFDPQPSKTGQSFGWSVVINHGAFASPKSPNYVYTLYGHMGFAGTSPAPKGSSKDCFAPGIKIIPGQPLPHVNQGDLIGYQGSSGLPSPATHVHFTVMVGPSNQTTAMHNTSVPNAFPASPDWYTCNKLTYGEDPTPTNGWRSVTVTAKTSCDSWTEVNPPSATTSIVGGVTAVTSNYVWIVGADSAGVFAYHGDGTSWTPTPLPPGLAGMSAPSALSITDAWAVGAGPSPSGATTALAIHWDGSTWSPTSKPPQNVPGGSNVLTGVAAVNDTDVWAVGYYNDAAGNRHPLVENWNGTDWAIEQGPWNPGPFAVQTVAAAGPDIWITGLNSAGGSAVLRLHNGAWNSVTTQSFGSAYSFDSVAAVSPTDVWLIGTYTAFDFTFQTLAEQCDGTSCVVPAPTQNPNPQGAEHLFYSASVAPAGDIWAVGDYSAPGNKAVQTLVEHWDGSAWSVIPSPNDPNTAGFDSLYGVSATAGSVWAVGRYWGTVPPSTSPQFHGLIEFAPTAT